MTSSELRHDGKAHREREGKGHEHFTLEQSSGSKGQRALDRDDDVKSQQEKGVAAEDRLPTSSEELAEEIER